MENYLTSQATKVIQVKRYLHLGEMSKNADF